MYECDIENNGQELLKASSILHMHPETLKRRLRDLAEWFPEGVWMISANHDERLPKAFNGNLDLGLLIEDIPGVHFSNYRYMWIDTCRGPVYACHQQNFSQNPVTVGQRIYDILPEKAHVVVTHIHRRESGASKDGKYVRA